MIGDIDSTIPVGVTHLIDRSGEVCQQHGGVVTAVQYDALEEMPLEKFLTEVVPTLKDRKESLTVIKDTVHSYMYRILNDNVAIYHVQNVEDVFIDAFMEKLSNERPFSITPNLTYPLVKYATNRNGEKLICVAIPERQFTYHTVSNCYEPFVAWHPPMWFYVKLSPANIPTGVKIGVVLDRCDDVAKTDVFHLPFPNIYHNGNVCFGSTHFTNPNPNKALTEAAAIELTYQRIFNSEFNSDLLNDSEMEEFTRLAKLDPDYEKIIDELRNTSSYAKRFAMKVKIAFKDRAGVFKYNYKRRVTGSDFLSSI